LSDRPDDRGAPGTRSLRPAPAAGTAGKGDTGHLYLLYAPRGPGLMSDRTPLQRGTASKAIDVAADVIRPETDKGEAA